MIALAAVIVYSDSFSGPFIFDDVMAVTKNQTMRHLWPIWKVLAPPGELPVGGRPVVNLSYAINYALSGKSVWSYHVFNLLIHILAGLTLFGVVRRTFLQPVLHSRLGADSTTLALGIALLWVVHPLQTEAVTYISQRAESMMGLFYLLTLYCFIRHAEQLSDQRPWAGFCILACFLGMGTKEVMVTAPIMVFIYDRTFIAGNFHEAWRQRWRLHAALMSSWLLLGYLLLDIGKRGVGFVDVTPWSYALTECQGIIHYLRLCLIPWPLVLDYGDGVITDPMRVLPQIVLLAILLAGTVAAFLYRPVPGFAGVWFFGILALTSSFIPVAGQPVAEHRVYLSLAAVMTLLVLGLHALPGRKSWIVISGMVLVYGSLTLLRNADYQTAVSIWKVSLDERPDNMRARDSYGYALSDAKMYNEAIAQFQYVLRLHPKDAEAHYNLGLTYLHTDRPHDAVSEYRQAIQDKPDFADAYYNLGKVLFQMNQLPEATDEFQKDLKLNPQDADADTYLGSAQARTGHPLDSIPYFQAALAINPDSVEAHNNFGIALEMLGRTNEAADQFREALRLDPNYTQASNNLERLETPATPTSGQ